MAVVCELLGVSDIRRVFRTAAGGIVAAAALIAQQPQHADDAFRAAVQPFVKTHCVRCHGPDKQKGDIALHELLAAPQQDPASWELVLDMLQSQEMPPADEPQPTAEERDRTAARIDALLRHAARNDHTPRTIARRLTNFEYHNTLRDLLGVELELTDELPEDPTHPYEFNNNARFLLLGLEQLDRYGDIARRAMASVIVDPERPDVVKKALSFGPSSRSMPDPTAMQTDELGIFGNRNRTVANGMRVDNCPQTGEFAIRVKASAILPEGIDEVPLEIRLGYDIRGVGVAPTNTATPVATLRLRNTVDDPKTFELRGRLENFPYQPGHSYRRGGKIDGAKVVIPPHFTVTPVNVYDDGTLNDDPDPLTRPRAVVEWLEFEAPVFDAWPPLHHTRILFESPLRESDPPAYVAEVLRRFLPRAFRRPVDENEVARFVRVYEIVSEQLALTSLEAAMRETLATALISPDFLLHTTTAGHGDEDYVVASRLSYFLWGSMPDRELFELAAAGKLRDRAVVAAQARRMLADERARDFVEHFATQWLALDKMRTVPIDLKRFPRFLYTIKRGERSGREHPNRPTIRDWMHAETVAFVEELIRRNESLFAIVDSDFAMLNQPLAAHYGVVGVQGNTLRPVELHDEHHLGGLLTHGSFLVGTATGSAPHPIYRAVWLREAILGDEVPDPPADVPALEDSAGEEAVKTAVTLKDLLRLHRTKESCNDCHARLDPWGIPFERYDATGRYRPMVPPSGIAVSGFDKRQHHDLTAYRQYLDDLCTVDVDATSRVPYGPAGGVEVDGVAGLKRHLLEARRDDIAENVTRRLLTYALARDLDHADRYVVEDLLHESAARGHGLRDLIVAICTCDAFLASDAASPDRTPRRDMR